MTLLEEDKDGSLRKGFQAVSTNLDATVTNWSSDISGSANMTLQAAFFNKRFDVWEYIIEPLEKEDRSWFFWSLEARVSGSF